MYNAVEWGSIPENFISIKIFQGAKQGTLF